VTGLMLVPAVGEFAAFGGCTIATAFGVEHPMLDRRVLTALEAPLMLLSASHLLPVRSAFYSGLTLDAVQQRAEVYKGLILTSPVLRAYLAGAFEDVDCVTHAKTSKVFQLGASKRWLANRRKMTGQLLVPAVGEFAAFGHCTIATASIQCWTGLSNRRALPALERASILLPLSVKPRRTATCAKRRRGKSPATPTHGLMTPLLLPPTVHTNLLQYTACQARQDGHSTRTSPTPLCNVLTYLAVNI
jgi:hypothetical protein